MHRNNLRERLEKYHPSDKEEVRARTLMLDFLNSRTDCFERSCEIGHFTGSCWLENYDGTKFLLTLHRKIKIWLQVGGHADGDPDILRVALKEAHEESGLQHIEPVSSEIFDISVHLVPEYKGIPAHYHYDVRFIARASNFNEKIKISDESDDLKWFSVPPLSVATDDSEIVRMFKKWKQLKEKQVA